MVLGQVSCNTPHHVCLLFTESLCCQLLDSLRALGAAPSRPSQIRAGQLLRLAQASEAAHHMASCSRNPPTR